MVRFEANRSFTGMGHERFASLDQAKGSRPAAVVAQRMFATGQVSAVHVYGNVITVELAKGAGAQGLEQVVRDLYQYWKPGMEPPAFEDLVAEEETAAPAASDGGDGPALTGRPGPFGQIISATPGSRKPEEIGIFVPAPSPGVRREVLQL